MQQVKQVSEFQWLFLQAIENNATWMSVITDPSLNQHQAYRNQAFSMFIASLFDLTNSGNGVLKRLRADPDAMAIDYIAYYLPVAQALLDGAGAVLGVFTPDEHLVMVEMRHRAAHGVQEGVHKASRNFWHWDDGPKQRTWTKDEINETLIDQWTKHNGPDGFLTAMRCKLGPVRLFFWDLLGGIRVCHHQGLFMLGPEQILQFKRASPLVKIVLKDDTYAATEAHLGEANKSFFEFWKAAGSQDALQPDPFVAIAEAFLTSASS